MVISAIMCRYFSHDFCKAKFHLVDLAGSERLKKTHAEGDRMKEGRPIHTKHIFTYNNYYNLKEINDTVFFYKIVFLMTV